jgi:hypothetical protein
MAKVIEFLRTEALSECVRACHSAPTGKGQRVLFAGKDVSKRLDGLTTKEAALVLGVPQGTVKAQLARARAKFAGIIRVKQFHAWAPNRFTYMGPKERNLGELGLGGGW